MCSMFPEKPFILSSDVSRRDCFFKAIYNVPLTRIELLKERNSVSRPQTSSNSIFFYIDSS